MLRRKHLHFLIAMRTMSSSPTRRASRLFGLLALSAIAWCGVAPGLSGHGLAWPQGAAAIDLDEARPPSQEASGPLPHPKDRFAPVHRKPDFLTDEEWAGVQATARSSADPAHETARLVDYLRFQKLYFEWTAEKTAQPAHARQLARRLMNGLPDKVAQGVVGAEQADQTLEQLVDFLEPDPLAQERMLARERRRLPTQPSAPPAFGH
jgi:hypothetical protein